MSRSRLDFTAREEVPLPDPMKTMEIIFDRIKDVYLDFDKEKHKKHVLESVSQDSTVEWAVSSFLDRVALEDCNLHLRLSFHDLSEISSMGFLFTLLEEVSLNEYISASNKSCYEVFKETQRASYRFIFQPSSQADLMSSAIEKTSMLLRVLRLVGFARIIDQHIKFQKLKYQIEKDKSDVQGAVDYVQNLLDEDRSGQMLKDMERKELERLIYNAARKRGVIPSHFYIENVKRLDEHPFGGGSYGDVYNAHIRTVPFPGFLFPMPWPSSVKIEHVAVKVPRIFSDSRKEEMHRDLCKEAVIWKRLEHVNILYLCGLCREGFPSIGLVSPFCHNGDVLAYVKRYPQMNKKSLMMQICSGVHYMHRKTPEAVHGDLKCANILIDYKGVVKIADFGLARLVGIATSTATSGGRGTFRWQAPELIDASEHGGDGQRTTQTDVYAFGMTCLELHTEKVPFHGMSDMAVAVMAHEGTGLERALVAAEGCEYLIQILQACCPTNSDSRMTMRDIAETIFAS